MDLKSFFRRQPQPDAPRSRKSASESADAVQQARTRARQRLIGAVVLLGLGIIGFPLLFETQPRPIPVDLPIEIPKKEGAAPLALPAPRAVAASKAAMDAKPVIVETAADAGREVAPNATATSAPAPTPAPSVPLKAAEALHPKQAPEKIVEKAASKPEPRADDGNRAKALLEGQPAASNGRFVVQVGAFAEAGAARDTRLKVEKLGLKTYTQVVETDNGRRIRVRVGPFGSRDDADKAASKIKAAGLPSAVLTL
jgi:DedD protein